MWGVLEVPGYDHKIIPTATMMNNYIFWALVGAATGKSCHLDAPHYTFLWRNTNAI